MDGHGGSCVAEPPDRRALGSASAQIVVTGSGRNAAPQTISSELAIVGSGTGWTVPRFHKTQGDFGYFGHFGYCEYSFISIKLGATRNLKTLNALP